MEDVMIWETKNGLVLAAFTVAVFILALLLAGETFSCMVCDVIQTMLQ